MDKSVFAEWPPQVTLRAPSTDRPWRALWEWLLAPIDQEKAASVEARGENHTPDDDDAHEEGTGDSPSAQ